MNLIMNDRATAVASKTNLPLVNPLKGSRVGLFVNRDS